MASIPQTPSNGDRELGHWAKLFDELRWTLLNSATTSQKDEGDDRETIVQRQSLIERDLAWAEGLRFDPEISDEEFWRQAATKHFYAGKRASGIRPKEAHMLSLLGDPEELCHPEWDPRTGARFKRFIADPGCVPNPLSLERTIRTARRLQDIKRTNSNQSLISFYVKARDWNTDAPMQTIHERLNNLLKFGYVTTLHFMADLGLPVVKPDRVVTRLAIRLGLIESYVRNERTYPLKLDLTGPEAKKLGETPAFNWTLQAIFSRVAAETGIAMRALDLIIVKLGQDPDHQYGHVRTVCGDQPLCNVCRAQPLCSYGNRNRKRHKM